MLDEHLGMARVLAGGQSLVPMLHMRLMRPSAVVDVNRLGDELGGIDARASEVVIGALTRYVELERSPVIAERLPILQHVVSYIGDPQVRNRGTIGGSLAHSDPAADYPAVMVALDAEIHLKGPGGWRAVKASDFFQDMFTVDMAEDEIIAAVQVPPAQHAAYAKLHQRASHYAIVGVAAVLEMNGRTCSSARIGLTGASTHAKRLPQVEAALAGKELTQANIDAAASLAADGLEDVNSDIHASEEYRRAMVKVFTRRAIEKAAGR
jgi:carbon-monoxide dehydrogenase medium subunit